MQIPRLLEKQLAEELRPGRVWMLFGARRVGKTMLVRDFVARDKGRWLTWQGEDAAAAAVFKSPTADRFKQTFQGIEGLFLDEAQAIPAIGVGLKLLVDTLPDLKVVVTGSSAFQLEQESGAPLAGRRVVRTLHPVSFAEIRAWRGPLAPQGLLEDLMIYGQYPEVLCLGQPLERREYLRQLAADYLLRDILSFENLKHARKLTQLLQLVAWQTGNEVSLNELAGQLQLNKATVERYLDLLEKSFVLRRIGGFARNLRKEVTKSVRYYFHDNGIRNAIVDQFQPLSMRNDTGALWESLVVNERIRRCDYERLERQHHFWRTYDQQELDHIETTADGTIEGFECKWSPRSYGIPKAWQRVYPEAPVHLVHRENFGDYF
jgi:predicted AAA+ superfamily ATPase